MSQQIPKDFLLPSPNWQALIDNPTPVIFDIGANDGGTTASFLHQFPNSFVYSFEPDPRAIQRFKFRIAAGQINLKNCVLFEGAVSGSSGVMPFYQSQGENPDVPWYDTGWDLSGSLKRPLNPQLQDIPSIRFDSTIEVPVITLNDWNKEKRIRSVDLMWIDVQGAELDVLRGASDLLSKTRFIYLECAEKTEYAGQPTIDQLCAILSNHSLVHRYPNDALFQLRLR